MIDRILSALGLEKVVRPQSATTQSNCSSERSAGDLIDLHDDFALTFSLLDNTRQWRERCVHEFVLRDSDHVEASTSYQIRLPLEKVKVFAPDVQPGQLVRLLLPLTVRPKQLLLNVGFRGASDSPITLLLRQEAAEVQAQYIAHLAGHALGDQPLRGNLWFAISAFTGDAWRDHQAQASRGFRRLLPARRRRVSALISYLSEGGGVRPDRARVERWLADLEPARQQLVEALDEGEDFDSPAECILLAVPFMPFKPPNLTDIDALVREYVRAVDGLDAEVRGTLAEYGRRWEVLVDTTIPVGQVVIVSMHDQRPWVNTPSAWFEQHVPFGDSTTTHVELRSGDHAVILDRFEVKHLDGSALRRGTIDAIRDSADAVSAYSSADDRPYFGAIHVRARVRLAQRLVVLWLVALIGVAGALVVSIPEHDGFADSLSLLTFPLTLAGAVVLAREPSALAERLLRRWRVALAAAIASLWIAATIRLGLFADVSFVESLWSGIDAAVDWLADAIPLNEGDSDNG